MPDFVFDTQKPVENLDDVPKNFHHMYSEGDDGFALSDESRSVAETINALGANLKNSRTTKKSVSDESAARRLRLGVFEGAFTTAGFDGEDFSEEAVGGFLTGLTTKAGEGADIQERLNSQKSEMTRSHTAALATKDTELGGMRKSLDKYLLSSQATSAIAAEKGVPDLLMPFVMQQSKVQKLENGDYVARVLDDAGEVRYNGNGDPMTVGQLVKSMKDDEKYGRLFDAETTTGGGTKTSPKPIGKVNTNDTGDKTSLGKISAGLKGLHSGRR